MSTIKDKQTSRVKSHPLVNTTEPNHLEDTFDYSLPPLIKFDGPIIEYIDGEPIKFDPDDVKTRDIFVTDTTFRDGQQARPPYSIDQMVHLYDLMAKLGGPNGVIRQTEFFLYTKNDRETLDRCRELGHRYPECTGWIRAVKADFRPSPPGSAVRAVTSQDHVAKISIQRRRSNRDAP